MDILYRVYGRVVSGKGRGTKMGIATANLDVKTSIPSGVYAGKAQVKGKIYLAAISCGNSPYFGDVDKDVIEVHLIDGECSKGDILEVTFYKYIRAQRKDFTSTLDLIHTIHNDIEYVRNYFIY